MESVRVCVVGQTRARKASNSKSVPVRVSSRVRKEMAALYDNECKQCAHRMYASMKCKDESIRRKAHNDYRSICRRKRAAWLESRMIEIEYVLHEDRANLWQLVDR